MHVHVSPLRADEAVLVGDVRVASLARTLSDIARMMPFEQAVVSADAALHADLAVPDELAEAVARAKGWPRRSAGSTGRGVRGWPQRERR